MNRTPLGEKLPDFPWDSLAAAKAKAAAHPDGIINLSVGTPVDPVSPGVQLGLASTAAEPGYPATAGTPELQQAIVSAMERRYHVTGLDAKSVLPVIGSKEAIAWLPTLLGLSGHRIVIPSLAYPTYEVGARLAGAEAIRADETADFGDASLVYLNYPANPTGQVAPVEHLREVVAWARANDAIVASDECYLGLGWNDDNPPVSILDPRVCDGDHTGLLALHSLSKTANLASYRAAFIAGDRALVQELLAVRKHAGLIVPGPIQSAMVAALDDDASEQLQRRLYARRRVALMKALTAAGFSIDHSDGGLYLWATRGEDCRATVDWLAERGILVAPGDFYGPAGKQYIRMGLNGTDEGIAAAVERLGR